MSGPRLLPSLRNRLTTCHRLSTCAASSILVHREAFHRHDASPETCLFHGMEEVKGSNPFRSTKTFQALTVPQSAKHVITGVQLESKRTFSAWAAMGHRVKFRQCPLLRPRIQLVGAVGQRGHRFMRVVCWRRQHLISYIGGCPLRPGVPCSRAAATRPRTDCPVRKGSGSASERSGQTAREVRRWFERRGQKWRVS
jgi:hypothetical protein